MYARKREPVTMPTHPRQQLYSTLFYSPQHLKPTTTNRALHSVDMGGMKDVALGVVVQAGWDSGD